MFWIVLILVVFRWKLLEWFLGTKRMYLFDALLFTILSAINFANPGVNSWFGYTVACICGVGAFWSTRMFTHFDEVQKVKNEQGKPNS